MSTFRLANQWTKPLSPTPGIDTDGIPSSDFTHMSYGRQEEPGKSQERVVNAWNESETGGPFGNGVKCMRQISWQQGLYHCLLLTENFSLLSDHSLSTPCLPGLCLAFALPQESKSYFRIRLVYSFLSTFITITLFTRQDGQTRPSCPSPRRPS